MNYEQPLTSPQEEMSRPADAPYQVMQQLAEEDVLRIRDFAFTDDDERHKGIGSVFPVQKKSTDAIYVALYDFQAEASNELSIEAGMPVRIHAELADGWVLAQRIEPPELTGLIPYTYLQPIG